MQIDPNTVELWFRYEEVAMHFNNLLMQYRLQLLGGAGALGTVAGYLIGEKVHDAYRKARLQLLFSVGMLLLIIAAASLDVLYYDKLLRGAVDAILDLERQNPQLNMSTEIHAWAKSGEDTIWYVYGMIVAVVAIFTALSAGRCVMLWYRKQQQKRFNVA